MVGILIPTKRKKLASERAKKKGIQQIQESTAQALGEPITQPTSIQKAVEEGIAKIQQAAVEKASAEASAEASAKSPSVLGSLKGMWNESQALYEADQEKEQQREREKKQRQAAIEMEGFKSQLRREELQLQRELNQESLRSLVDQARDSINQAVQEGITRIQDSTQSHEDATLGLQRAANQAIKDIKFAKEYYSKSGVSDASTNTLEVPPQPLSYQPPATITADDLLPELLVVPSASPRTPVLDAEELRRRLEKLQEGTHIMGLTKLRGEVERLEPSQSVAFTELPGAPAVPHESPGPRVVGPRRREMAMRFGTQPMPQAPKPPPPTAPIPSGSFISFTDPTLLFPQPMPQAPTPPIIPPGKSSVGIAVGAEEIPQITASDILPQAPTPPTPARFPSVPPLPPKGPFVFSSHLQPPAPEAQFQSMSLPQSPFSTAFTSLPPQSNIKPSPSSSQPSEPYIPSPQGYSLPPTDRSEIEKLLWDRQEEPKEPKKPSGPPGPSGPSGPPGQPQPKNSREEMEERRARIISDMGYPPIDETEDIMQIEQVYNMKDELKNDIRIQTGKLVGLQNKKNKTTEDKINITMQKELTDTMVKYRNKLLEHLKFLERTQLEGDNEDEGEIFEEGRTKQVKRAQKGQGIKYFNSPGQLFDRLELLAGSISAGNNGVVNEFTEIAHVLRNMGILSQTALNKLLRKFILDK